MSETWKRIDCNQNCFRVFQHRLHQVPGTVHSPVMCKCFNTIHKEDFIQPFNLVVFGINNNNNNNNLCLIMVKTNRSMLYNIQQSATQGSNDMTYRLSRRTAAATRFSREGIGCQKWTAPRFCQYLIRWALLQCRMCLLTT